MHDKTDCPNVWKQLKKHPEPLTKAKRKTWFFSTSEIKISCCTESQAYITPLIHNLSFCSSLFKASVEEDDEASERGREEEQ